MRTHLFRFFVLSAVVASVPLGSAWAAIVVGPTHVVGAVPLPGLNNGAFAPAGTALLVGQGPFGVGTQSIVRRDADGTATTLVTNLNALGGMAYDAAGNRLLFTDNGGQQVGATTGDTIYALPSPLTAAAPVSAATLKLLPDGSLPFAQAILPLAGGDILIGDAAGPGSGRIVKLSGGVPTNLITGLDYTAGVSLRVVGNEILIANVDGSFVGAVQRYSLAGASLGTLAGGLSGAYDQALDAAGNLLLTGGFANDFTSSIVSITPAGAVSEFASGFGFSSSIAIDGATQQIQVLDFGTARVDTLTPISGMTPGGFGAKDCHLEEWGGAPERSNAGKPRTRWSCADGDPACDRDGAVNGSCSFLVGACFTITDSWTPKCTPTTADTITVTSTKLPAAAADIQAAVSVVLPNAGPVCSPGAEVVTPADKKTRTIILDSTKAGKRLDKDTLKLRCLP